MPPAASAIAVQQDLTEYVEPAMRLEHWYNPSYILLHQMLLRGPNHQVRLSVLVGFVFITHIPAQWTEVPDLCIKVCPHFPFDVF